MTTETQVLNFDTEASLQDALASSGLGGRSKFEDMQRLLDDGIPVIITAPHMPARALIRKSAIEALVGHAISGPDLMAIPFV